MMRIRNIILKISLRPFAGGQNGGGGGEGGGTLRLQVQIEEIHWRRRSSSWFLATDDALTLFRSPNTASEKEMHTI